MYEQIAANKRKTVFIFALFFVLVGGLAWLFGQYVGRPSMTYGVLVGAVVYAFISYLAGSRLTLAMNGAHPIAKKDSPRLYRIVENLAITEGLPMPKIYIIQDPAPNAFATGRNPDHAVVAATTGLLEIMDDKELEGVMAHELGHVKNLDMRVSLVAFALVAVVSILADFMFRLAWWGGDDDDSGSGSIFFFVGIIAAILAPFIAALIQMAVSRRREYLADATGALATRYPEGLASALEKLRQHGRPMKRQNPSTAHFFIVNPLKGKSIATLFSTHPQLDDRIARLRDMG